MLIGMIRDCFSNVVQYLTEGTDTMYASGNGCPQVLLCRLPGLTKFYPPYTLEKQDIFEVRFTDFTASQLSFCLSE